MSLMGWTEKCRPALETHSSLSFVLLLSGLNMITAFSILKLQCLEGHSKYLNLYPIVMLFCISLSQNILNLIFGRQLFTKSLPETNSLSAFRHGKDESNNKKITKMVPNLSHTPPPLLHTQLPFNLMETPLQKHHPLGILLVQVRLGQGPKCFAHSQQYIYV